MPTFVCLIACKYRFVRRCVCFRLGVCVCVFFVCSCLCVCARIRARVSVCVGSLDTGLVHPWMQLAVELLRTYLRMCVCMFVQCVQCRAPRGVPERTVPPCKHGGILPKMEAKLAQTNGHPLLIYG